LEILTQPGDLNAGAQKFLNGIGNIFGKQVEEEMISIIDDAEFYLSRLCQRRHSLRQSANDRILTVHDDLNLCLLATGPGGKQPVRAKHGGVWLAILRPCGWPHTKLRLLTCRRLDHGARLRLILQGVASLAQVNELAVAPRFQEMVVI
jgi:hypothetical protein